MADLASAAADAKAVVELGQPALRFSPVNATTSVFFDETNKQVCGPPPPAHLPNNPLRSPK